jgi:acetyl-CoA synthetase
MESRLSKFMQANGFNVSEDSSSYKKFHDWSVSSQDKFYSKALDDIKFPWIKKPSKILEYKKDEPIYTAEWFVGGKANVYDACIEEHIRRGRGDSIAAIFYREDGLATQLTFNQVKDKVEALAAHLVNDGVRKGDRVCIILPSSEYSYLIFYATQKIGAVFVPIPTEVMDMALIKRLEMTRPKIIFSVDNFVYNKKVTPGILNITNALREINKKEQYAPKLIKIAYIDSSGKQDNHTASNAVEYTYWISAKTTKSGATEPMSNKDITMILFTSGTTGTPKGTMHTYAALIEDMLENAYSSDLNEGDRFMWYTSPGWMMFPWLLMGGNGLGATIVLYDGSPTIGGKETLVKFAQDFNLTHIGISPPLIINFVESLDEMPNYAGQIGKLRQIRYTSSPLADSLAKRLDKLGYAPNGACGGTDGCFCYCSCNSVVRKNGAKMLPGLGIDVHVMLNEEGHWRDAKPDEIGEIVIKSPFPSMTRGLLSDGFDMQIFKKTYFHNSRYPKSDYEGKYWFHGDLASFDAKGYLTVHGRADDLLVVHGSKLSPMDVQDAILKYNPEIQDVAPISLSVHEGDGGELLIFAVLNKGSANLDGEDKGQLDSRIKGTVKEKVNKLAKPYKVFFVNAIPYTINNKPALRIIKKAFTGEDIGDTSTIRNKDSINEILQLSKGFIIGK